MQSFNQLMDAARTRHLIEVGPGWGQGRTLYGGLTGALLLSHILGLVGHERVLRSLTVSFVGPVSVGQVELRGEVLREGKSALQAEARILQDGQVCAVMLASFGQPRASQIEVSPQYEAPQVRSVAQSYRIPYMEGRMPEFFQRYDLHWARGKPPFAGASEPDFAGWMRFHHEEGEETERIDLPHLVGLVDAWPPSVLPLFKAPAAASTLTWTLEIIDWPGDMQAQDYWQYNVHTDAAADGYSHAQAMVWDKHGNLVAISRQTVAVFA